MIPYFNDFVSFDEWKAKSRSFMIHVLLNDKTSVSSSVIPNTPETLEVVLRAVATSTNGDYREPFVIWNHRVMTIIPPETIVQIRVEFAPLELTKQ